MSMSEPPPSLEELHRAHRQLERMRHCFGVCRSISSSLSMEGILETLMASVMDTLGAENCSLFLTAEEGEELFLSISRGPICKDLPRGMRLRKGEGFVGQAFERMETVLVPAIAPDDVQQNSQLHPHCRGRMRTVLCIPLVAEVRLLGVAKIANKQDGTSFDAEDQEIFEIACKQAAISIHNAFLHQVELAHQHRESQLEQAAKVHELLLPRRPPQAPGLEISAASLSCDAVGGDFYDYLILAGNPDLLGIVVGDGTDHGPGAALLMATARAYVRACVPLLFDPAAMLQRINEHFTTDMFGSGYFCTLFLLVADTRRRCLSWASAGHEGMLLYTPSRGEFRELRNPSLALGCDEDCSYQAQEFCTCEPGQVCLIGTDGIWEAVSTTGERYGRERVRQALKGAAHLPAEDIKTAVLEDLERFRGAAEQQDDVTLVVLKSL